MKQGSYPGVVIAVGVSGMAMGFSYWQLPYSQLTLPNSLFGIGMLVTLVAGIAIRATGIAKFHETTLIVAAIFVAVVLIRVVADVMADPKSHNLWPFEIIIAGIVGLVVGAVAAAIGNRVNSRRALSGSE